MIIFAALTPHPPIIIPEVGKTETKKVQRTILAMQRLSQDLANSEPEIIIVISPHGLIYPDKINICGMKKVFGTMAQFGAPEVMLEFKNDLELAQEIDETAQKEDFGIVPYDNSGEFYELDHGVMVPLYYLSKKLDSPVRVIPMSYAYQNSSYHFKFGKILGDVCKHGPKRIAIIASGDLSHRLIESAPAGFSPAGKIFDEKLVKLIKENKINDILEIDDEEREQAGECGYNSLVILLGAIADKKYIPDVYSYEGPFGVGYGVVNFKLKG